MNHNNLELIERYTGALVGVHAGDSIGAPYETWGPKKIAVDIKDRGSLTFFHYENPWPNDDNGDILPSGRPTDDSDQTADLAYSLIRCNGLNPDDLRNSLKRSVLEGKSQLWDGQATGADGTTRKSLGDDTVKRTQALSNNIGTNGSLMRSAPMALWLGPTTDRDSLVTPVCRMSEVTHTHTHSKQACVMYTTILCRILAGETWHEFKSLSRLEERIASRLFDPDDFPYDPGAWPARGTAEFSLYVALYALKNSNSFAEGIEIAVRVGGDTDTYAAIAGGLLGAYYGHENIPLDWRQAILGHDVMVDYAEKLYAMRANK